ncbi:hypothetical protein [Mariprofundus ferrooxydans]|uniref:hypothetical protein n=1 Tax=Mariprofundus ferrooxydans TaxID=314344 RepID=UPI0003768045|nr:hypothetical protein [Mariprofundus ferrooxydans]
MNKWLLAIVLMLLAALFWWRLDENALHAAIVDQTSRLSGSRMEAESARLNLMHGVGLRLDHVTFTSPGLSVQAGHVDVSIHLLPLLFGKVEMGTLDVHDAHVKLDGDALASLSVSFASLPFDRVHMNRATIDDAEGSPQLENIQLDVRNIGLNREALWEISARHGAYALQGHGQIAFRAGAVMSGFGKMKLKSIPASLLTSVAPAMLTEWFSRQNRRLTGGLTLDITRHQGWSLFGEIEAQDDVTVAGQEQEPMRLRGKISHPADGELVWHDSFIHLQDRAVIALDGHCLSGKCESRLDARNVPVGAWFKLLPQTTLLPWFDGNTRLTGMVRWHGDAWQASGSLGLTRLSYHHEQQQALGLPAMRLVASDLHGDRGGWTGQAQVSFPQFEGVIDLQAESAAGIRHRSHPGWQLKLASEKLADGVWQPLGNLLLSSLKQVPELSGSGALRAGIILHEEPKHSQLQIDLDAAQATVGYGEQQWLKPAGFAASCQATIGWQSLISQPDSIQMDNCTLDTTHLAHLEYAQTKKVDTLKLFELQLDLDHLNENHFILPAWLRLWHGSVEGNGSLVWQHETGALVDADGVWDLQQLGTAGWRLAGRVKAAGGVFSSDHLQVSGTPWQAELRGEFSAPARRGAIDVLDSSLDWQTLPPLPAEWMDLRLHGHIDKANLNLGGYQWQGISSDYQLSQGQLKLIHGQVPFASGLLQTDALVLEPGQDLLRIYGKIRGRDLLLEQMPWMGAWLQADLSGKMQANVELKGTLPVAGLGDWQHSNGDITIYSGTWLPHTVQQSKEVADAAPAAFKRLKLRFRIHEQDADLSGIDLTSHGKRYRGDALITADGAITGALRGSSALILSGKWPHPEWQPQP